MTRKITKSNQSEQRSDRGAKRSDRGGAHGGGAGLHPYAFISIQGTVAVAPFVSIMISPFLSPTFHSTSRLSPLDLFLAYQPE